MRADDHRPSAGGARHNVHPRIIAVGLICFMSAMVLLSATPLVLNRLYPPEDYSRVSDVGQAFGAASALIALLALGVVVATLVVQLRQLRNEQIGKLRARNEEMVRLSMDDPVYRQCWGARMSPADIDEDLFYFCSDVIKLWTHAWELKDLPEDQARTFLRQFFDSEVPRRYWEHHGDWHMPRERRSSRENFHELVNDEFLRMRKSGLPPSRRMETRPLMTNEAPINGLGLSRDPLDSKKMVQRRRRAG